MNLNTPVTMGRPQTIRPCIPPANDDHPFAFCRDGLINNGIPNIPFILLSEVIHR